MKRLVTLCALFLLVPISVALAIPTGPPGTWGYEGFMGSKSAPYSGCVFGASEATIELIRAAMGSEPTNSNPNPEGGTDACWDDLPGAGGTRNLDTLAVRAAESGLRYVELGNVSVDLTARQSQLHAFVEWDYPEQQMSGEPGTPPGPVEAVFDLAATRHPDVDVVVQVAWGDGSTTNVTVPAGTGTFGTALRHAYAAPAE